VLGLSALAATTGSGVTGFDVINLFSAATSIVLAVVALALSIFFFVQSKKAAEQGSKSAEEISASVTRLEKIFDSLYSDTFTMMRETVTDMRHHVWKIAPTKSTTGIEEEDAEGRRSELESAVLTELSKVSRNIGLTDAKIAELTSRLTPVINRTLGEQHSRVKAGVQWTFREMLVKLLEKRPMSVAQLMKELHAPEDAVVDAIFFLQRDGLVLWDGAPKSLKTDIPIFYINPVTVSPITEVH
jgi:hypothetical protein